MFLKNRCQPYFKSILSWQAFHFLLDEFGIEIQNEDSPDEDTAETSLIFRSGNEQVDSE